MSIVNYSGKKGIELADQSANKVLKQMITFGENDNIIRKQFAGTIPFF
jgi:hypothetical protein